MKNFKLLIVSLIREERANVAIVFALLFLPMLGLIGLGIDFSRVIVVKRILDSSADAAALSTVTSASSVVSNGLQPWGQNAGADIFAADAADVQSWIGGIPTPRIQFAQQALNLTATVSYSATVPAVFGVLFGKSSYQISGSASAQLTAPPFVDIALAIDTSQSMGLGASQLDIEVLESATPDQCAFGCHYQRNLEYPPYEVYAHNLNLHLRIDSIKSVAQAMISAAQANSAGNGLVAFSLFTLQTGLTAVSAPNSTDYQTLLNEVGQIDLGNNTSAGSGDTIYNESMPALTQAVGSSGQGTSASDRKQFVFILTDGVEDYPGPCQSGHCTSAFDPSQCDRLKANGVTVGVVYTTYLAMPNNTDYMTLVAPFANQLATNLQACASPGWFYQATDAVDINSALNSLFTSATGQGILTQ